MAALNVSQTAPLPKFGDYMALELWEHQRGEPGRPHRRKHFAVRVDYQRRPLLGMHSCPSGRCPLQSFQAQVGKT